VLELICLNDTKSGALKFAHVSQTQYCKKFGRLLTSTANALFKQCYEIFGEFREGYEDRLLDLESLELILRNFQVV
jgi:hypothetical protein